jgi:hypothetical protein
MLAPGASASFAEEWELMPHRFPNETEAVDLDGIRQAAGARG